jgi:hypothetical protein
MRHLWCASVVLALFWLGSCGKKHMLSKSDKVTAPQDSASVYLFWPNSDTLLSAVKFRTSVTIYGKLVDGILFLRKMNAQTYRATFLAKGALKLFDMELQEDTFVVVSHAAQLSNQAALRTLAKDMQLLTFQLHQTYWPLHVIENENKQSEIQKAIPAGFLFYCYQDGRLEKVVQTDAKHKETLSLQFSEYQNGRPFKTILHHQRFRMQIELIFLQEE